MANKRPVYYSQLDIRWKDRSYSAPGEKTTIGISGCGPACAAMLIETLTGKKTTPVDTCKWSVEHGYKAVGQGTYYSYFVPQFEAYGIHCRQLNWNSLYHKPDNAVHDDAFKYLKEGYYLIALMKKGNWTSGGHFVVVWWENDYVLINDPASTSDRRTRGDIKTFRNECAYYWLVDARKHNLGDDDMDQEKFSQMFEVAMEQYRANLKDNDASKWSEEARAWCIEHGVISGSSKTNPNYMWEDLITKEQAAVMLYNFAKANGLA